MQRASQQAPTQTTATPETSRAVSSSPAQAHPASAYSGNRAALRRLAAAYPNVQRNLLGESVAAEPPRTHIAVSPASPQVSRACAHCEEEEKQTPVQRKENTAAQPTAPASVHEALNSPGQPLDPATRAFMEPRFGSSFDQVRIHTGRQSADSARSIGASAYTVGRDIVFASGHYAPNTPKGQRLLAHELTHVLQQGHAAPDAAPQQPPPAVQTKLVVNTPGDPFEQEADRVADRVMRTADPTAISSAPQQIQREEATVDIPAKVSEIEQLVRPGNDEKGALDKLKALDMGDLLKVIEQIYNDALANEGDEGKRNSHTILGNDILPPDARPTPGPGDSLTVAERNKIRAAFDAAPTRKLRNPKEGDPGTSTTLSGSRDMSKSTTMARPGDWGEDPGGNTWVCHTDGIRSYFASGVPSEMRTSTWLGNNPSNFDYAPSLTKRAISSFHWGKGVHHFAIYLNEADASADLRDRVRPFGTIGTYIKAHLGNNPKDNNRGPDAYIKDMNRAVAVNAGDAASAWTDDPDPKKWPSLMEGFKAAEGWKSVPTITAGTVSGLSTDPKDAPLIAYYQKLLGATP